MRRPANRGRQYRSCSASTLVQLLAPRRSRRRRRRRLSLVFVVRLLVATACDFITNSRGVVAVVVVWRLFVLSFGLDALAPGVLLEAA
jgi:hypothetical protein